MDPTRNHVIIYRKCYIYFTGGAFKSLVQHANLRLPYSSAAIFMNNVFSTDDGVRVESNGKAVVKKIGDRSKWCFGISIPSEVDTNE